MKMDGSEPEAADDGSVEVGIAEFAVTANGDRLATFGLGSCVAVAIYEPDSGIAGLAHVMLPSASRTNGDVDPEDAGKFADTAIRAMIAGMEDHGADRSRMRAKVVGGSEMFDFSGIAEGVGRRNVEAAREELTSLGVPIEAEDVGGDHGRSVEVDGATGTVELKTARNDVTEL